MSNNLQFLELGSYEAPTVKEDNRDEWVEWGDNNDFFEFLIERYNNSTTNSAIINNTSKLIYGRGLSAVDGHRKPNEYATAISLFKKETVRRLCKDLKMLGNCAMQVIYNKNGSKIVQVEHIPVHLLRPSKCDEDGQINHYFYSDNWEDTKKFPPKKLNAFGTTNKGSEILYIKPYGVNLKYFSLPDWFGGIKYAQLEEEIASYLLNTTQTGFSPTAILNMNNGIPDSKTMQETKRKIMQNLTGANGQKLVVSFNNDKDSATTIEPVNIDNAPELYNQISTECEKKIMLAHNIVSPLMFGIASKNGFSSNSEELQNSFILYNNMYILPVQDLLIDAFNDILLYNNITLDLYFKTLKPLEFTDKEDRGQEKDIDEDQEKEGTNLSGDKRRITKDEGDKILNEIKGESMSDDFEEVDSRAYSEENSSIDEWIEEHEGSQKLSLIQRLSSVIKSRPSDSSLLDKSKYKVRYRYTEKYSKENSRDFCSQMMQRTRNGVVYRLEDIDIASRSGVNQELGHKGQPYDLFRFKGGVNCSHYWSEVLYRLKKNKDGSWRQDKGLASSNEVAGIPKSYIPTPRGKARSQEVEYDRKDKGHHPNYKG
tara:strand:- start:3332 stop:5122 length:1791 start_codon:yes stop_codon:yes gene_type:complete